MKWVLIALVRTYQYAISPLTGRRCRFFPTRSEYTIDALRQCGAWKGGWLGVKRIFRCHPWHPGGYDPLP